MKAKKKPIEEIPAITIENLVEITKMEIPSRTRLNKIFGDTDEDIQNVVKLLHEEAKVI